MANEHLNSTNISRARLVAGAALVWERLWPLVLPLIGVFAVFLIVSWFGLWPLLNDNIRLASLGLFGLGAIWALMPLRHFRWPSSNEIDRRLETDTQLSHRPLQTQSDRLASINGADDAFSKALWQKHQKRMSEKLGRLESSVPSPSIATKDPFALRSLVVLGLFAAFLTSFSLSGGRVADAFVSHEPTPLETARIDA